MTPSFFAENPEAVLRLGVGAGLWLDTPFRANSAAPGERGGVDCVRLAAALLDGAGAIPPVEFPRYAVDAASHLSTSPLLDFLRGPALAGHLEELPDFAHETYRPFPGDVVVLNVGRTPYHLGVVTSERGDFCHVLRGRRVTVSSLADATYADRLQTVFRPVAKGVQT